MILGAKQFKAIELQYDGKSTAEIAEILRVSPKNILKWQEDTDYRNALAQVVGQQLSHLLPAAIKTIKDILEDDLVRPNLRLQASKAVLDYYSSMIAPSIHQDVKVLVEYV